MKKYLNFMQNGKKWINDPMVKGVTTLVNMFVHQIAEPLATKIIVQ